MKRLTGFLVILALAGCATPIEIPKTVYESVPVPCLDPADRPQRPQLRTEEQLLGLDRYRRTHALWAEWLKLQTYVPQLEAVVEGCSRIPAMAQPGGDRATP